MREYRYRKHIRWGQYLFPIFDAGVIAFIAIALHYLQSGSMPRDAGVVIVIRGLYVALVFFAASGFVSWFLFYRMAGVRIALDEDGVVYRHRHGEKRIRYGDITGLDFASIRYLGGWCRIRSADFTIRLTVILEGIDQFVRELKLAMEARGLSDRYEEEALFRFYKTAVFSDQGWSRISEHFWRLIFLTIAALVASGAVAVGMELRAGVIVVPVAAAIPGMTFSALEYVHGRRIAREADPKAFTAPERDVFKERKLNRDATMIGLGVFFLIMLAAVLLSY